ncbi:hypothetical protein ACR42D_10750 [Desulfovibrio caledoniensis]
MHLDKIKQQAADAAEHTVNEFKEETAKAYKEAEDAAEGLWARHKVTIIACAVAVVCIIVAVAAMAE